MNEVHPFLGRWEVRAELRPQPRRPLPDRDSVLLLECVEGEWGIRAFLPFDLGNDWLVEGEA